MIAYFDCFSGISGDMVLGALVDAGCDLKSLEAQLRGLPVDDWQISSSRVKRCGLAATRVRVQSAAHQPHRSLSEILQLIERAGLPARVRQRAALIFRRLGEAESHVHGVSLDQVHFHEVGAVDAIVDIVGACAGLEILGVSEVFCSPLNLGSGQVKTEHGTLPVPAPATAYLLQGVPTYSKGIQAELVTPTGAAIASSLTVRFCPQPAMRVKAIGYGAGSTELNGQPNVLRLFTTDVIEQEFAGSGEEAIVVLETNLDDMSPQLYGHFIDRALEAGALDVFATPVQMKKNRPGLLISIMCEPEKAALLTELVFRETTTIGVRSHLTHRRKLERELVSVQTPLGAIRVKVARLNGHILNASPEYEDCARVAADMGMPLKEVLAEALSQFRQLQGDLEKP